VSADKHSRATVSLRLAPDLLRRLDAAAEERDVGRNWLIGRLLEEGLERLVPVDELFVRRPAR
jgi:predicted transcriptional regulator